MASSEIHSYHFLRVFDISDDIDVDLGIDVVGVGVMLKEHLCKIGPVRLQ